MSIFKGTTELKKIYIWVEPQLIQSPGIYWNESDGIISMSSNGTTWITMADKNLGATTVYNSGDTLSQSNCGKYYQRGNNYGFPRTGSITTSTTQVNARNYGPSNYYSSSTFILNKTSTSPYGWDSSQNANLRGGTTGTKEAMRGPCPSGFYIPTKTDFETFLSILTSLGLLVQGSTDATVLNRYLKIPFAGDREYTSSGAAGNQGTWLRLWSSTGVTSGSNSGMSYWQVAYSGYYYPMNSTSRCYGASIRPFKNEAVQPDDSWTVLYQAS